VRSAYGLTATAFEKRWQQQTRRRYGALAIFTDLTLGVFLLFLVVVPLYVSRRRRDRRRMRDLRAADVAAERRAREESVLDELLRDTLPAGAAPGGTPGDSTPPATPPGEPTR